MDAQQTRVIIVFAAILGVLVVLSLFWVAILRTSKRRAEAEHHVRQATEQARNELEERVAEATADLTAANHRLKQEVEARRKSEDAIRQSEKRFRILFESSHDAMMTLEPPLWNFTSGNPACLAMFGAKDVEEFTSRGPGSLSPERQPDGRASSEKAREMIETAMHEGSHFFDWTHKRIDGEEFPATVLLTRMEHAGNIIVQATVTDITERKRAEEALAEEHAFTESSLHGISDLFYAFDTAGTFLRWNTAFSRVIGYSDALLSR